jgi:hypothetical protein
MGSYRYPPHVFLADSRKFSRKKLGHECGKCLSECRLRAVARSSDTRKNRRKNCVSIVRCWGPVRVATNRTLAVRLQRRVVRARGFESAWFFYAASDN